MPNDFQSAPPPSGDSKKADQYVRKLTQLVNSDKLTVTHTDLTQYEPCSIADHYKVTMQDYEVEFSHTKQPDTNRDYYVMLFNNIKYIEGSNTSKIILAYTHLTPEQFKSFKQAALFQIERVKLEEERKRFEAAMRPIDQALNEVDSTDSDATVNTNETIPSASPILDPDQELPAHTQPSSYQPTTPSILQSFSTPSTSN